MRSTFVYLVAAGIILAAALVPWLRRSRHPAALLLVRSVGPRPSGLNGTWTRRDHLRAAGIHVGLMTALWIVAMAIFTLADRWPINSPMNTAVSVPGLGLMFGGIVLLWFAGRSLWRAAVGAPLSPPPRGGA